MRLLVLAGLLGLLTAGAAPAEDTLRCGSRLVNIGDGKDKVRSLCGEPSDVAFVGTMGRRAYPGYDSYDVLQRELHVEPEPDRHDRRLRDSRQRRQP